MIAETQRCLDHRSRWTIVLIWTLAWLTFGLLSLRVNAEETIDPRSGRLFATVTDLVLQAGPIKLELERSLDTRRNEQGLLGTRWRLNWESRLLRNADLVLIEEGSGTLIFTQQGGAADYQSGSGERLVFEKDGRAVRHKPDDSSETFDSQGRLSERVDRNGNTVALRHDPAGRLARIDAPRGSFVQFSVDKSGRITKVEDSGGRTVQYTYSGDLLAEVQVYASAPLRYGYDVQSRLTTIEDPATGRVEFGYDIAGRVLNRRWADGAAERYEYDDANNSVRLIDPAGATTTMRWSADKRQAEITDPLGRKSSITYDAAGRPVSVSGPTGATSRMTYDTAGRLLVAENPAGQLTRFDYVGASSRVNTVSQPDGTRQTFEYDGRGNLTATRVGAETVAALTYKPDGTVATVKASGETERKFAYRPDGRFESITNALGESSRFEYDRRGNLIRTINPLGGATVRTYDAQDRVVSITDPARGITRYEYDPAGRVIAITDANAAVTRYGYDSRGRLVSESDPAGQTTRWEYDAAGRLSRTIFPGGQSETFRYDAAGNVVAAVDHLGRANRMEYDALGRVIRDRDAAGREVEYRYDPAGQRIGHRDALGPGPAFQRDAAGRLTEIRTQSGATVRYAYDAVGRLISVTNPLGQAKHLGYDATGALAEVREADGTAAGYGYDAAGRLAAVRHPGGGETRFGYDALGNPVRETNPVGQELVGTYDRAGRLVAIKHPNGHTIAYSYDALGRPVEKRLPNGGRVTYQYDSRGYLLRVDDGAFPIVYIRDSQGRATRIDYPALKRNLAYEYTAAGLLSRMIDSEGREIKYEYDVASRLAAIGLPSGGTIRLTSDVRGRITTIEYPNGVTGRSAYDSENRLTSLSYADATGKVVAGWRYSYDAAGNRIETVDAKGRATRYRYDPAGQLLEETASGDESVRYSYVAGGNRARREAGSNSTQYRYDTADRLLEAGAASFAYDANGNLVERRGPSGVTRYEYDPENRLIKVTLPGGADVAYGYAPTGERIWRRDATGITYFVTDGVNVLAELDANLNAKATYVHGPQIDTPLVMERDSRRYYYHADRAGSVGALTGDHGQIVVAYDYDAFGNLKKPVASVVNSFTYTAREFDSATGLYYYRARYYDPDVGRFVSVDPVAPRLDQPFELNPYAFVGNNPLGFADPLGLARETLGQRLAIAQSSLQSGRANLAWAQGVPGGPGALEAPYLAQIARAEAEIAELMAQHPGLTPELPTGWGPSTPEAIGPGRVRAGGGAAPGQPPPSVTLDGPPPGGGPAGGGGRVRAGGGAAAGSPPPGATADVPLPGGRGGPTLKVRPGGEASGTQAVQPGATPGSGSGISWGRVGAGVIVGATGLAEVAACLNEPGKTAKDCLAEAGLIVGAAGLGAGLVYVAPAVMAALLAAGASPALLAAAGVTAAVAGVAATAAGVYHAGNRLVDAANAPAAQAEAARQAELEARFNTLFPKLAAAIETKVSAFEKKAVTSSTEDVNDAKARAAAFANSAEDNLNALREQLSQAGAFCAIAASLQQQLAAISADSAQRVTSLETGLNAADGMVSQCASQADVKWAKDLYQTGTGMVAEMVVKASQAERAQGLLQQARAAADSALAAADQRAQMIAGNAEVAAAAASAATSADLTAKGTNAQALSQERSDLDAEIARFPNWFPPRREVQDAVAGWKGRVAAAASRAQESRPDQAQASSADLDAARAASRRDEAQNLINEAKARISACADAATGAAESAVADTTAANTAASGTLSRFSSIPAKADICLVSLARNLLALHVRCPEKVFVNEMASCTAVGFYSDNPTNVVDMTAGDWPIGPSFTSAAPGAVTVRITRGNMSDAAIVMFEAKPSEPAPTTQVVESPPPSNAAEPPPPTKSAQPYDLSKDPGMGRTAPGSVARAGQEGGGFNQGVPVSGGQAGNKTGFGGAPVTTQPSLEGTATGGGGGTALGPSTPQGVWCFSDQSQSYFQLPSYPCPPGSAPSGPPPSAALPGQSRPRAGGLAPGLPPALAGISVLGAPVPPRSPPGSAPQPGGNQPPTGGGTTGGGTAPPKPGTPPPVIAQTPPASGGQCSQPICYRSGQTDCDNSVPISVPTCYANMLKRCNQGMAGGTGGWCVHKGADASCEARARRVCEEASQQGVWGK